MADQPYRDPSRDYPPTRPTFKMLLIALAVAAVAIAIVNWSQLSTSTQVARIEQDIAHVGL